MPRSRRWLKHTVCSVSLVSKASLFAQGCGVRLLHRIRVLHHASQVFAMAPVDQICTKRRANTTTYHQAGTAAKKRPAAAVAAPPPMPAAPPAAAGELEAGPNPATPPPKKKRQQHTVPAPAPAPVNSGAEFVGWMGGPPMFEDLLPRNQRQTRQLFLVN
jgi:hypothetical protein